jgi:hypothetical protein
MILPLSHFKKLNIMVLFKDTGVRKLISTEM